MANDILDTQATCALCGRSIRGRTFVKPLNGHRFEFDKSDCEVIFSKLTSVYGAAFGLSLKDS